MAKVMVVLRVLPADVEVDVEGLSARIQMAISKLGKGFALQSYKIEPIAFGLKALRLIVVMPEETEGGTYLIEEALRGVEGVGEVEVEVVSRIS
ncbi:MAG: elongation factor 1-beta [Candidatus Verstraetearchaeota archaeon]|nr:elongation factor 1-beta [Candidatus Verstraetearchaeota archaeon]